jgi:hypothetical protein
MAAKAIAPGPTLPVRIVSSTASPGYGLIVNQSNAIKLNK